METWDTIRARRNVRQYTAQPIARDDLERICEAGRRAPSAGNWQPWNFVVVTGRGQLIELAKVWDPGGRYIASSAAAIALVAKEPEDARRRDFLMYDLGQATANMMPRAIWMRTWVPRRVRSGSAGRGGSGGRRANSAIRIEPGHWPVDVVAGQAGTQTGPATGRTQQERAATLAAG